MTVKYYAILTNQGAARLANATMLGSKLNLTQMAVGDANGVLPTPDPAQTKLINQKRIAPLNLLSVDPNNQSQIIAEQIIPENEGGFWIREIGLYDDEGVLIAVANCPETYKPQLQEGSGRTQTIRMILVVTNTEAITLKIDPSVVLATRKYVDDKISEHEQSRRHPDASLTVKGFTQLSSAINSESETLAATPKAVKAAYDLANKKYTAQNATTTQKGIVQLSSATNSTSETLAATPKAVKAAYDLANGKYTAQDATTTQKGIVQLSSDTNSTSETLAATPKAVKAAYDLAAGKAPSSHKHPWNQITGVPTASLTAKGITQLSSATNSTSEVLAATPKAVKAAYDLANGKYTAQDATTTQKGIVQLSSDTNSTSETLAATPKAVKAAYDLAAGKAPSSHKHPWNQITGVPTASLTAKGITQLSSDTNSTSETLAATPKAVKAAYDLAAGKAPSSHTHPWNQITGVPTASLTAKGITQLSSATNSTSEVLAATPKAVKAAYDLANGKQAADATLTALAALATAADKLPYFTGVDRAALTALTSVGRAILSKPSIQSVLNYLGLGEAAKRNVGTGENQVPDMNSFGNSLTANGYQKLPGGMIIQWGSFSVSPTGGSVGTVDITLPVAFPAACRSVNALISTNDPSARSVGFDIGSTNRTKIRFTYTSATTNSIYWMAVGY
ncbi:tail fiber protein [Escherichia coli]|uniref:tail fiber protein n=14 Tax=Enterobacterales TaxID=91347 RepID=UPI001BDB7514|nr:tail fiber protein [Escherichia coli]